MCVCQGHHHREHGPAHGRFHGGDAWCGCGGGSGAGFRRRFRTKEEIVEDLRAYLEELKAETAAVEERLAETKAG